MKTMTLTTKQLEALITKTNATLTSLRGELAARRQTEIKDFAKHVSRLHGDEKLDACLVPVDFIEASNLGARGMSGADRKKVVRYFKRRSISGTSEFHTNPWTKSETLYAKSKSGNIYRLSDGSHGRVTLTLVGKGVKP